MTQLKSTEDHRIVCVNHTLDSFGQEIEACAQFQYKGYVISMSSAGKLHGGCKREVVVFDDKENTVKLTHSVEEAIDFVNNIE